MCARGKRDGEAQHPEVADDVKRKTMVMEPLIDLICDEHCR
jgi:hypothetical protein